MPCFYPNKLWTSREVGTGKNAFAKTFSKSKALRPDDPPELVPCGYCIGCKVSLANEWGVRAHHEASLYAFGNGSAFLTLTFDDEHLPHDNSVRRITMQSFMRKLRKILPKGTRIRFIDCGEYGDKKGRAHYHALVFNWSFPDRKIAGYSGQYSMYESDLLNQAWSAPDGKPLGLAKIGSVTFATGKYVASYTMKKVRASKDVKPYIRPHSVTGELHEVERQFALMSRGGNEKGGGGIGHPWAEQFKSDIYPSGLVIIDGRKYRLPQAYVDRFSPEEQAFIKRQRKAHAKKLDPADSTPERMRTKEECLRLKLAQQERSALA